MYIGKISPQECELWLNANAVMLLAEGDFGRGSTDTMASQRLISNREVCYRLVEAV